MRPLLFNPERQLYMVGLSFVLSAMSMFAVSCDRKTPPPAVAPAAPSSTAKGEAAKAPAEPRSSDRQDPVTTSPTQTPPEVQAQQVIQRAKDALAALRRLPPEKGSQSDLEYAITFDAESKTLRSSIALLMARSRDELATVQEPLVALVAQLQAQRRAEEANLIDVAIASPREMDQGFVGEDTFSKQDVYIETKNPPERLRNTLKLLPIQGRFRRDGTRMVTNRLGAVFEIPKLIDPSGHTNEAIDKVNSALEQVRTSFAETLPPLEQEILAPWQSARDALVASLTRVALSRIASASASADADAAKAEHDLHGITRQFEVTLAGLLVVPDQGAKIADAIASACEAGKTTSDDVRHQLEKTLSEALKPMRESLSNAPSMLADVERSIDTKSVLGTLDQERSKNAKERTDAVFDAARKALQSRDDQLRHKALSRGITPQWFFEHGSQASIVGLVASGRVRLCRVENGVLSGEVEVVADSKALDHIDAWRAGTFTALRAGDETTLLTPGLAASSLFLNLRREDIYSDSKGLVIAGFGPDDSGRSGLWTINMRGEAKKGADHVRPGLLATDRLLMLVAEPEAGDASNDSLLVLDMETRAESNTLKESLERINREAGPEVRMRISGGKVWVYSDKGIQGLSSGPTLVEMRPDGSFGSPLFAHRGHSSESEYKRQPVGSHSMRVLSAEGVVLGRHVAIVAGMEGEPFGGPYRVTCLRLPGGEEEWSDVYQQSTNTRDLIDESIEKHAGAMNAKFDPSPPTPKATAECRVVRTSLSVPGAEPRTIAEYKLKGEGRELSVYILSSNSVAKSDSAAAFLWQGWFYFGEDALHAVPMP